MPGKVFRIPYQDIEAIVSEVSLKEFGSSEIQRRAIEDMEWIKDKALMHEKAIETAMNNSDGLIIPMRFGTIFKNRKSLIGSLKKDYLKFKNLLKCLKGKEEQSVKIYCKSELFENEIKKISDSLGPTKKVRSELKDEMIVRARQREMKPVYESVLGPVKGYVVRCPFHKNGQEKHASLNIKGSHYFCHCCGEKGNPIDFLMKVSGLSFKDAVMALQ